MNIKDDFIQAIDYMIQSPFVQKINGIVIPDEWGPTQTLRATGKFDNVVAKEICDSAYMLSDIKKELEAARDAITIAGQDAPELCMDALKEHFGDASAMQTELDAVQRELKELPQVDEVFMAACRKKEQSLIDERDAKKEAIRKGGGKVQQIHTKSVHRGKQILIVTFLMGIIGLAGSFILKPTTTSLQIVFEFFGIYIGFMSFVLTLILMLIEFVRYKNRLPKELAGELREIDEIYSDKFKTLHKQMEKGYDESSEIYKKTENAKLKAELIRNKYKAKSEKAENFEAVLKEPFQKAPPLLQRAIDNMDSLVAWATNYMRDKETRQHNAMMQSIEQDRLEAQELANRKQNELLKQQADAAARQAKDTAEIKKRMQNERYGDYWKSK